MELINNVNELYEKYKKNSKLSQVDKENAKEGLLKLLKNEETRDIGIDLIIKFPEDIGIASYIEYYKTLSYEEQKKINAVFVNNKEFKANVSFRSINRGTALIGHMFKEKQGNFTRYIFKNTCNLVMSGNPRDISIKVIEVFRKNILNDYSEDLFNLKLDKIDDRDYYQIEKVIINSAFELLKGQALKPVAQYGTLNWLRLSGRKIKLTGHEKEIVQNTLNLWPDEMKNILNNDIDLRNSYEDSINFDEMMNTEKHILYAQSNTKSEENIAQKIEEQDENAKYQTEQKTEQVRDQGVPKPRQLRDIVLRVAKEIESMENDLKLKEEKIEAILETLGLTQKQYEQKLIENERLIQKNNDYMEENNKLKSEFESGRIQLKLYEDELNRLKEKENENKQKIDALLDMDAREDSNALKEFKSKLAGKLKYQYMDFMEIADYSMSNDLGENLRLQMKEIFKILINQGIIL